MENDSNSYSPHRCNENTKKTSNTVELEETIHETEIYRSTFNFIGAMKLVERFAFSVVNIPLASLNIPHRIFALGGKKQERRGKGERGGKGHEVRSYRKKKLVRYFFRRFPFFSVSSIPWANCRCERMERS